MLIIHHYDQDDCVLSDHDYALNDYVLSDYALNDYVLNDYALNDYVLNDYALSDYVLNDYALSDYVLKDHDHDLQTLAHGNVLNQNE